MTTVQEMAVTETGHRASSALDDLYRKHGAEVYRYAYAVLGNHADAEDVTQTTFLNAHRALEQGVRPRKPPNWLLTIASNAIKQRFRQEKSRPFQVELDERIAHAEPDDDGPSIGELLTALSKIPPQQRQAIVLREFEGRSYAEIAEILSVTTSALETEAQAAVSKAVDDRLGRKERRRLRDHVAECPDCARFARLQQRHRSALRGLMLVPIPLSFSIFKGLEGAGTATAATMPAAAGAGASAAVVSAGVGTGLGAAGAGGGAVAGGVALKAAAVVAAAGIAGGVAVTGATELDNRPAKAPSATKPGQRLGQVAPRGVTVPGNGVARGKPTAPGQVKKAGLAKSSRSNAERAAERRRTAKARADARAAARAQKVRAAKRANATTPKSTKTPSKSTANRGQANGRAEPVKPQRSQQPEAKPARPEPPPMPEQQAKLEKAARQPTAEQPAPTDSKAANDHTGGRRARAR
jgi:RNA polymerase sigma factor (sigma-70 family)